MIRIGLIGYGFMGKMHSECYAAEGSARIVSVADAEISRRGEAEAKLGCETFESLNAMLNGPEVDVIDICSPTFQHEEHALTAVKAGKHVLCEKPLALSVESGEKIIAAAKSAGVKLMVGHVVRFWPECIGLKEVLDSGIIGKPLWGSARRLGSTPTWAWNQWMRDPNASGGPILDLHIHDLDYFAWILGRPERIVSTGVRTETGAWGTTLSMCYNHACGANSQVEGSLAMPDGFPFTASMLVTCEKGTVGIDFSAEKTLVVHPEGKPARYPAVPVPVAHSADAGGNISSLGGYYNEIAYFMKCLQENKDPETITPEEAVYAIRICLAAKESVETGRIVDLD